MIEDIIRSDIRQALNELEAINSVSYGAIDPASTYPFRPYRLKKVLVANRGEIAKRFFLALHEEGIPSVAVVTDPDRGQSWYEFADEVLFIGHYDNYAHIPTIAASVIFSGANAVYSGYGFLSENADFVENLDYLSKTLHREIIFMGPSLATMRLMGHKTSARRLVREQGVALFESTDIIEDGDPEHALRAAESISYPVMVKLCSGGGGKGMSPAYSRHELRSIIQSAVRIGKKLYNDQAFYLERYIENPIHIEVQIFNGTTIGIRKCAVQRRNQKIIEESGHVFLEEKLAREIVDAAEKVTHISGYSLGGGTGTVEFLIDADNGTYGFLEMNTRLQVEYAVTDQSLGIDIAKWQILHFDGRESEITGLETLKHRLFENEHSIECRIYAEDPENDYLPSPGSIIELDLPTFNGIRCDFGFTEGDAILPMYDPMIGKLIAHGSTRKEAIIRLERALQELYIKGVKTNIHQLLRIVRHECFIRGDYTNTFLKNNPELNFKEVSDKTDRSIQDTEPLHIMFGAFSEYIQHLQQSVRNFMVLATIEDIMHAPADTRIQDRYIVQYASCSYAVEFLELSVDTFVCLVDGKPSGTLILISINDRSDDMIILTGKRSFRVRINRQSGVIDLRMKDHSNKINYYRMTVRPEGTGKKENLTKLMSPFQGMFISFCGDGFSVGDYVKEGTPLMILSSMKMETVFHAPAGGKLTHIIEDGVISRLQLSRTADGRIIGRSVQEGELLATIETEAIDENRRTPREGGHVEECQKNSNASMYDMFFSDLIPDSRAADGHPRLTSFFELMYSAIQGIIHQPRINAMILKSFKKTASEIRPSLLDGEITGIIEKSILHYTRIKKLFSPVVLETGLSFQEELGLYLKEGENSNFRYSAEFIRLLEELFESYDLYRFRSKSELQAMVKSYVFYLCKKSHQFCVDNQDLLKKNVELLSLLPAVPYSIQKTLQGLMEQEQSEPDDSLVKFLRGILGQWFEVTANAHVRADSNDAVAIPGADQSDMQSPYRTSLAGAPLSDDGILSLVDSLQCCESTVSSLKRIQSVKRLHSPSPRIVPIMIDGQRIPHCIAFINVPGGIRPDMRDTIDEASELLTRYGRLVPGASLWIHFCSSRYVITWEGTVDGAENEFSVFKKSLNENAFRGGMHFGILIDTLVRYPFETISREVTLQVRDSGSTVQMDHLPPGNMHSPYHDHLHYSKADQRQYDISKWPIEYWATECFDPGSMNELRIPSIDESHDGIEVFPARQVGAKIFMGTIHGSPACFYMKDSRISGGSTGNREGLKYCAAAYLAYCRDIPLYVWNDSAGANIMEGVISLNRGAEGFMMNTLLAERVSTKQFVAMTEHNPDQSLRELFTEIRTIFGVSCEGMSSNHRSFSLTAIGIGSSAGLDVYGSSQAPIQILLDSEQSYRVLTGSNVIYSVIGEAISNYDIGGAKILGKWTGIVDIVAQDKLHLCAVIRIIHEIFSHERDLPSILRRPLNGPHEPSGSICAVLDENQILDNVDRGMFCPFKHEYFAAQSLIGGFAVIGGRRALILGPRTDTGLRNRDSLIKMRELMKTAYRTGSHQLLLFGRSFLQTAASDASMSHQTMVDLFSTLNARTSGIRIHIIRHIEGMKNYDINASADIILFVRSKESDRELTATQWKKATFVVDSIGEAFDLSHRLIKMIDPLDVPSMHSDPEGKPVIPDNPGEPYEIIESVITKTVDAESFIEFYRDMNNPITGPHLVTGLATLKGQTVGIMADQPLLKGGGADAFGTEKMRVFTSFLNAHGIPLIMLSNSSGFVPGSRQERYRIQAIGAESLDTNISGRIPVVSIVLNQNYGGRLIQAFNKFLRPGIVYLARSTAVMAVIGVDAAFDLLFGKKHARLIDEGKHERAAELKKEFYENYLTKAQAKNDGVNSGLVDWTIDDIADLRDHLVRGLILAMERCRAAFGETTHPSL